MGVLARRLRAGIRASQRQINNSGYDVKGEDPMDLRDEIIRADAHARDKRS
jgi:hypothetical protein